MSLYNRVVNTLPKTGRFSLKQVTPFGRRVTPAGVLGVLARLETEGRIKRVSRFIWERTSEPERSTKKVNIRLFTEDVDEAKAHSRASGELFHTILRRWLQQGRLASMAPSTPEPKSMTQRLHEVLDPSKSLDAETKLLAARAVLDVDATQMSARSKLDVLKLILSPET